MTFDFNKAIASAANNPALLQFLNDNKTGLSTMTEQQILGIIVAYTGGNFADVVNRFFGGPVAAPAGAVGDIVGNTADIAQRRYEAYQRFIQIASLVSGIIVAAIQAGVLL